jgi:hypothetical protein
MATRLESDLPVSLVMQAVVGQPPVIARARADR